MKKEVCYKCGGNGELPIYFYTKAGDGVEYNICPFCKGYGKVWVRSDVLVVVTRNGI